MKSRLNLHVSVTVRVIRGEGQVSVLVLSIMGKGYLGIEWYS